MCGVAIAAFSIGACVQNGTSSRDGLQGSASAQSVPTQRTPPARSAIRNADDLAALSSTYAQIARKVTPAVVNIQSTTVIPGRVLRDPYSDFFGDGGRVLRERDRKSQSLGSGVLIDARGLIITNNHVIRNATQITVTLNDKRRFPARLLGADADSDVAVLKIEANDLPVLRWADSEKASVGDIVLAVGSPFGLSSTVTQGIISAKDRRDLGISAYEDFLQTDAAINPGNSGGALVNIDGDLVGINTAILSESGGNQGIGLAIPSVLAQQIIAQLAKNGRVTRGWLGVVVEPISSENAGEADLNDGGVLVTGIVPGSPAARLPWIENGTNILLSVNGTRLDSSGGLRNFLASMAPGQKLKLSVWQDGQINQFDVSSAPRPAGVPGV